MKTTTWWRWLAAIPGLLHLLVCSTAIAQRETVLKQIQVPHNYYFREMYLPQLTTGPSALAWSPDGSALVYSMAGSLWRQDINSDVAVQLTSGPGYDYQPDWSPDGRRIVFARYLADALELQVLDLDGGEITALTDEGAVNLEPRWSPDGKRIAHVSTRDTGRFHLYVGEFAEDALQSAMLFEERESEIPRYYYSAYDHAINPAWSPDGSEILYVGNPEIPYGTGAIWRRPSDGSGEPRLVRMEETSWRARPDWSPDGKRIAYASYLGRQWHQLWVTTPEGKAEPFPLTYGDFDISSPRFSPDGRSVAYVSNESGNTSIRIQDLVGGASSELDIGTRRYRQPMAMLSLEVLDENGRMVPARVAITASDGRSYAPPDAWMHADDGFDRRSRDYEMQYFHLDHRADIDLPPGQATVIVWHGIEHSIERVSVDVSAANDNELSVRLRPLALPAAFADWVSGDVHVHMNYGGTYRNTPARLADQMRAEDVDVVFNLIVNKEQRVPDIGYFSPDPDPASTDDVLIMHAQEFHTSYWGHLGLLGLDSHLLVPDYSAYPATAAASIFPDNATISTLAHEQGATVGYVHPFDPPAPDPAGDRALTNAFPVDVALGHADYYEVVGFADPHTSADVWYGLLNCGMRVSAAGGTDAMANYASLRGPVGINRTYVPVPGFAADRNARQSRWLAALREGRSLATNGPLLGLTVDGELPGSELKLAGASANVRVSGFMRSAVPVDHVELVVNGQVIRDYGAGEAVDISETVTIDESGWMLLRAWNDEAHPLIFDLYPYATTTPQYLVLNDQAPRSRRDGDYFIAWIGRIRESVEAHRDFNSAGERAAVLDQLARAEARFEECR